MIYAVIDFAFFRQHHNVILRAVRYIQSPHYFILVLLDQKTKHYFGHYYNLKMKAI